MIAVASDAEFSQLIERKAVEDLRYRYWYAILDKDVERLVSLFTEDICLEYGFGIVLNGKNAARDFFNQLLDAPNLVRQVPVVPMVSSNSQMTIQQKDAGWLKQLPSIGMSRLRPWLQSNTLRTTSKSRKTGPDEK